MRREFPVEWVDPEHGRNGDRGGIMPVAFLSIQETAKALGISRISAYRHVEAGTIPSVRVGSRRLIPASYLATLETEAFSSLSPSKANEER